MLLDKSFYDYDFSEEAMRKFKPEPQLKKRDAREVSSVLARFGFKTNMRSEDNRRKLTAEEAQRVVMEELGVNKNRQ